MDMNSRIRKAVKLAEDGPGVWRTINGTPVFIKEGQTVDEAVAERFAVKAVKITKEQGAKLKMLLDKNGGFSYQPVMHSSPVDGFMVSPYKEREQVIDEGGVDEKVISNFIEKNSDLLLKTDHHVGGWNDSGKTYLDVSVRYETSKEAQKAAKQHKQLAFFDIKLGKTIYTEEGGNDNGEKG